MRKNIYLDKNKKLDFYLSYTDNTVNLNLHMNNNNYEYFGYIIIDILNDYYDMVYDNEIMDLTNIIIFINQNKTDSNIQNLEIILEDYLDRDLDINTLSNLITKRCNIDKNKNYIISIPVKLYDYLILF